jgi:CheY-like chemotaxis protein
MRKLKILIVDDSAVMRKIIERVLRQAGLDLGEVLEVGNGAEALLEVQKGSLDIIVSDSNMPVWPATPPGWRTIFKCRKANSGQKRSPIPVRQLPPTLLRSGRFPHCRARGLYQASCARWRPDLLRSSYRQRRFVLRSIAPMYVRSNSHRSANASWDTPSLCLFCLTAFPNLTRIEKYDVVYLGMADGEAGTLTTCSHSSRRSRQKNGN